VSDCHQSIPRKNGNRNRLPFFIVATKGGLLAKPNYQFEKRQRDLAKKTKQEEKRRQKQAVKAGDAAALSPSEATDVLPTGEELPKI
jgi:hypothetical protein